MKLDVVAEKTPLSEAKDAACGANSMCATKVDGECRAQWTNGKKLRRLK